MKSGSEHSTHTPKPIPRPEGESLLVRSDPRRERGFERQRVVTKIEPSIWRGWTKGRARSSGLCESGQKTELIPGAPGSPEVTNARLSLGENTMRADVAVPQGRDGGNLG